ncbi:hypothetical protein AM1BK_13020 [Neobacillus kokaensis]|uniref:Uncharacterized protein n=1 Tax=Neobacillus kokaensis TaxID=2759023 RepID=A0ABQ3N104_9BACI|nr:hypothetical protein AM1BK_13020 [Neobacillus kokaensis]
MLLHELTEKIVREVRIMIDEEIILGKDPTRSLLGLAIITPSVNHLNRTLKCPIEPFYGTF